MLCSYIGEIWAAANIPLAEMSADDMAVPTSQAYADKSIWQLMEAGVKDGINRSQEAFTTFNIAGVKFEYIKAPYLGRSNRIRAPVATVKLLSVTSTNA